MALAEPEQDEGTLCEHCVHPMSTHGIEMTHDAVVIFCEDETCECRYEGKLKGA